MPWAVRFPAGSHAWVRQLNAGLVQPGDPLSLPVHPTQLYSCAAGLLCWASCWPTLVAIDGRAS